MYKLRIKKDFLVQWTIYKREDGIREPYNLEGKDLSFFYATAYAKKPIADFVVSGNIIEWKFKGKDQEHTAVHTLILVENDGKEGMMTVDKVEAFELVPHTFMESDNPSADVVIETVFLESEVALAPAVINVGEGEMAVDSVLSTTSVNPVQNRVITRALNDKASKSDLNLVAKDLTQTASALEGKISKKQDTLVSGGNIKTINGQSILGGGDITIEGVGGDLEGYATEEWVKKQGYTTEGWINNQNFASQNWVENQHFATEGFVEDQEYAKEADLAQKQDKLVSGQNIKTINGQPILGSGDITIEGSGDGVVDLSSYAKQEWVKEQGYATETWVNNKGYAVAADVDAELNKKQDSIADLAQIRSGAALGATALQSEEYRGTYDKPVNGIPKTDLANDIQLSLNKADVAAPQSTTYTKAEVDKMIEDINVSAELADYYTKTETYSKAEVDGIVRGVNESIEEVDVREKVSQLNAGMVDADEELEEVNTLPFVKYVQQTLTDEQKAIARENIGVGEGSEELTEIKASIESINTEIESINTALGNISTSTPEIDHGTEDTTLEIAPNVFHKWGEVASLSLSLGAEKEGVVNEFLFQFESGATATTLSLPDGIKWANDEAPTIEASKVYQISILHGMASILTFAL